MRHRYLIWGILPGLLGLASCAREERAEKQPASRAPTAARPDTSGVAADGERSLAWAARPSQPLVRPAASGRLKPVSTAPPAPRLPHQRHYPLRETPISVRPDSGKVAALPVAPGSPDARLAPALGGDQPKPAQVFRVRPDRDTVLYGAEGTRIRVPANAFVLGQGAAPTGIVELRLREFYTLADILLERLSTLAGPVLLETGGMVHLKATAGPQECQLRPGRRLELAFPTAQPVAGMQLYTSEAVPNRPLNWKLAPASLAASPATTAAGQKRKLGKASHWKQPNVGSYRELRENLSHDIAYEPATARRLNGNQPPRRLRRQLRRAYKRAPVVGTVEAAFEIAQRGGVADVYLLNPGKADSVLELSVLRALRGLIAGPSHRGKEPTRSLMKVRVRFTADRRVLVERLYWDRPATLAFYQADTASQAAVRRRGWLAGSDLRTATQASHYVFEAAQLGWHNCDHPILLAGRRVRVQVAPGSVHDDVSLILKSIRCVVPGIIHRSMTQFDQLPNGAPALLIGIRRDQGQFYLARRDITVSSQQQAALEYYPVSLAELKAAIAWR